MATLIRVIAIKRTIVGWVIGVLWIAVMAFLFGLALTLRNNELDKNTEILLQDKSNKQLALACYKDNYNGCSMNQTIQFDALKGENCNKLFNKLSKSEYGEYGMTRFYLSNLIVFINERSCKNAQF